jgi:hypothetical protein
MKTSLLSREGDPREVGVVGVLRRVGRGKAAFALMLSYKDPCATRMFENSAGRFRADRRGNQPGNSKVRRTGLRHSNGPDACGR